MRYKSLFVEANKIPTKREELFCPIGGLSGRDGREFLVKLEAIWHNKGVSGFLHENSVVCKWNLLSDPVAHWFLHKLELLMPLFERYDCVTIKPSMNAISIYILELQRRNYNLSSYPLIKRIDWNRRYPTADDGFHRNQYGYDLWDLDTRDRPSKAINFEIKSSPITDWGWG